MTEIFMRNKKTGSQVRVYEFFSLEGNPQALVFDESLYKTSGYGWTRIKLSNLLPLDMPLDNNSLVSKTEKNKIKKRLKLIYAEWETTDGKVFDHEHLEDAIKYEKELMEKEGE